jgi:hypothetical protein
MRQKKNVYICGAIDNDLVQKIMKELDCDYEMLSVFFDSNGGYSEDSLTLIQIFSDIALSRPVYFYAAGDLSSAAWDVFYKTSDVWKRTIFDSAFAAIHVGDYNSKVNRCNISGTLDNVRYKAIRERFKRDVEFFASQKAFTKEELNDIAIGKDINITASRFPGHPDFKEVTP